MRCVRWPCLALLLCLGNAFTGLSAESRHGQQSSGPSDVIATPDRGAIELWAADSALSALAKTWRSGDFLDASIPPTMSIADVSGDGINDLLLADRYGITVLGSQPAYYAFPDVSGSNDVFVTAADVDRDGTIEFLSSRNGDRTHAIEIWRPAPGGLRLLNRSVLPGVGYSPLVVNVDPDPAPELVTASDTIRVMKPRGPSDWRTVAELDNIGLYRRKTSASEEDFTLVDVVRVADLTGDGVNEIIASGNSGMVTVYQYRRQSNGRVAYPVLWQSPWLRHPDLTSGASAAPNVNTQGLAIGDLDGDGRPDIVVGTANDFGTSPDPDPTLRSHLHVFGFDGVRSFTQKWVSDWVAGSNIPGIEIGDLNGDGRNEFVHNGQTVYGYDAATQQYKVRASVPYRSSKFAVGRLGSLSEPEAATRIIQAGTSLPPGDRVKAGASTQISVTLKNVWAPAGHVSIEVSSTSTLVTVPRVTFHLGDMATGASAASPVFTVQARPVKASSSVDDLTFATVELVIRAAGGYVQKIPLSLWIRN